MPATFTRSPESAGIGGRGLALAAVAHDARNLVAALGLCAEVIAEPGVLAPECAHLRDQIRDLANASERLCRRLSSLCRQATVAASVPAAEKHVENMGLAVLELKNLLTATAGPAIDVQVAAMPCSGRLAISEESLSRILVNLVRNAADAMPQGGRVRITAQRAGGRSFCAEAGEPRDAAVLLCVEDSGPGVPPDLRERIFEPGFTTRAARRSWPDPQHHGLGLSIVRQLVEAAGGRIHAGASPGGGARFEMEFPLTNVTATLPSGGSAVAANEGR